ncbi:hypothetical protein F2Q69_00019637 [Brassica cretica]|uniref:Uncharacterized protein n=1 Tax=Brassica cretica TaxID=69181 RepID=A0A8S9QE49_BRACR|nr:hypothetical protein F2Q69_00019637 [Brassica cretica]
MSGNTKEKIAVRNKETPVATAPMANAYANATVLEKIENLDATFRHRKCNETSLRFLFLNIKGNNKSYQTPTLLGLRPPVRPPARYIATCQPSKSSSFVFSFESRSKRFSFRLNRSFR